MLLKCLIYLEQIKATTLNMPGAQPTLHFGGGNFHKILFDDVIVLIQP